MLQEIIQQIDNYVFSHQYDEALELINVLIEKLQGENLAYMYYYKAGVLTYKGCVEEALIAINKACYLSPSNVKYTVLKCNINAILGNNEAAMQNQINILEKLPGAIEGSQEDFENSIKYMKEIKQNLDNGEFNSKEEILDFLKEQTNCHAIEEDFDYEDFTQKLADQVKDLLPDDIDSNQGDYIFNSVKNFTLHTGNRLKYVNGDSLNDLILDDKYWVMQIVAEWIFHKSIDVQRSNLSVEICNRILYTITIGIYETIKQALEHDFEEEDLLNAIENNVNDVYKKSLEILLKEKDITQEVYDNAILQSNIDKINQTNLSS